MKKTGISFLAVAILMIAGMAFAIDIPNISSRTQSMGVGGGGPGRGDVLLAPLYDVRNLITENTPEGTTIPSTQQTYITIVNTATDYGVIARLRFREWKRSREVLDIDIPLTTNDVWVGLVAKNQTLGGAILDSPDQWISAIPTPDLVNSPFTGSAFPTGGIAFRTFLVDESSEAAKLARTEYGYFEVIGEERVGPRSANSYPRLAAGVDRDVKNVLIGNVYLIRPELAISHQYNMTALSNFSVDPAGIWENPATVFPNLLADVQGEGTNPGIGGFNQLEFILSKRFVYFTYVNGVDDASNTPMSTAVVITFPTKHFHYSLTGSHPILAVYPFGTPFTGAVETVGDGSVYGEIFGYSIYDRSENTFTTPGQPPISPPPPITPTVPRMPYEVNVIGLVPVDPPIIASTRINVAIATANTASAQVFKSGYGWFDLSPALGAAPDETRTARQGETGAFDFFGNAFTQYFGLPSIGIVMTEFFNDSVNGFYGNCVPWQYAVDWVAPVGVP